jgi:hypothetical protein
VDNVQLIPKTVCTEVVNKVVRPVAHP